MTKTRDLADLGGGFIQAGTGAQQRTVESKLQDVVSVLDFIPESQHAAIKAGTSTYDATANIQAAIDSVKGTKPIGGGTVYFPKGTYRTSSALTVYSDVCLEGDGLTSTYIKPLDSATFAANQGVIQTQNFSTVQGTNLWDYYSPYPTGLAMGVVLRNLCIDGNRVNVANASGVCIYGGKWTLENIAAINTSEHGIWTEAGIPGTSTAGNDFEDYLNMHESFATNIYICNANKHGWYYRGPNDSSIGDVQIKTCGWGGFYQESTGNNSVGNLEIRSLHAYACLCLHVANGAMITLANANAQFVYVDASSKNGLLLENAATIIDQVFVLKNNAQNAGTYWGVIINSPAQINTIRNADVERTSGTDGGLVQVNGTAAGTIIGQIRTTQTSGTTIPQIGVQLNASCLVGQTNIEAYDSVGSIGLDIRSSKINATLQAKNCVTAVSYNTAGRNLLKVNALDCITDIDYVVNAARTDDITLLSNNTSRAEHNTGKLSSSALNLDVTDVGSTASYTPDMSAVSYVKIVPLDTAITFNTPVNSAKGDVLDILIQQGAVGGHNITWSTDYKTGYSNTGNVAFSRHNITFIYDGTFWVERSKTGWF